MASVCKGLLSVAKRRLSPQIVQIPFKSRRSFCNEPSSSNPFLKILLQLPSHSFMFYNTLDSDARFVLKSSEFSWDALVSSLPSLSPEKAQEVVVWKLEKMLEENERDLDQYLNLICLCAKIQNVLRAMCVLTSMEVHGIKPTTYDRLDIFLEHIKGSHKLTKSTYDLLVAGYRRAGLSQRLDPVIKDMELGGVL